VTPECDKMAVGKTDHCIRHGGGTRCEHESGCTRAARGATRLCLAHGGGHHRCRETDCFERVQPGTLFCVDHRKLAPKLWNQCQVRVVLFETPGNVIESQLFQCVLVRSRALKEGTWFSMFDENRNGDSLATARRWR